MGRGHRPVVVRSHHRNRNRLLRVGPVGVRGIQGSGVVERVHVDVTGSLVGAQLVGEPGGRSHRLQGEGDQAPTGRQVVGHRAARDLFSGSLSDLPGHGGQDAGRSGSHSRRERVHHAASSATAADGRRNRGNLGHADAAASPSSPATGEDQSGRQEQQDRHDTKCQMREPQGHTSKGSAGHRSARLDRPGPQSRIPPENCTHPARFPGFRIMNTPSQGRIRPAHAGVGCRQAPGDAGGRRRIPPRCLSLPCPPSFC